MKKIILITTLFSILFCYSVDSISKEKAPPEFHNVRWYKIFASGLEVGHLAIEVTKTTNIYEVNIAIKSDGIAKKITKYWCNAKTVMQEKPAPQGHFYVPSSFETTFNFKKKTRHINIRYSGDGKVVGYINNPKEDPKKRPPVPANLKNGSYDPLTIALIVRERIRQMRDAGDLDKKEQFTLPLFDGRRRSDLKFTIHGRTTETINEEPTPVIHLSFENVPVHGYTNNELRDMPDTNPIINVYVSDDDILLPLKGDGTTRLGWATGSLYRECETMKDCNGI